MKRKRLFIISFIVFLFIAGILITLFRHNRQMLYKVTLLPSLGGNYTLPCAVNDRGQVAGFSEVASKTSHLFIWDSQNGIQDLGPVVVGPVYINNSGQIAATMHDPNGNERAFFWHPNDGRYILPTLGGKNASAHGINNNAQVIGAAETPSGVLHAFVWDAANGMRDLMASGTVDSLAWSINDTGRVVVFSQAALQLVDISKDITSTSLLMSINIPDKSLVGITTRINNKGFVTGLERSAKGTIDIVTWNSDSGQKRLIQSNIDLFGMNKVNDSNQVLYSKAQEAFIIFGYTLYPFQIKNYLHDPNLGRLSLNGYITISSNEMLCFTDLNNSGCIVGAIQSTRNSQSHGVLLEPIPQKWNK